MKRITYILILVIKFSSCMGQSIIEVKLKLKIPDDLNSVWINAQWNKSNNVFTLYNFNPFYLLDPLNKDEIIRQSKSLNGFLNSSDSDVKQSIVFAKSFLDDEGQFLFYGFGKDRENLGIWVWHIDKGSQFPTKIGDSLSEIFESKELMANGFGSAEIILKTWVKATHGKLQESDFIYGNFPRKDLKVIAEEICPNLIYFPNETTFLIEKKKQIEIDEFYSKLGRNGLLVEMKDKHLTELLMKVNMESFNQYKKNKIFVIQFFNSPIYGLCNCNKQQAKELNRYGYFSFYNLKDSKFAAKFINE